MPYSSRVKWIAISQPLRSKKKYNQDIRHKILFVFVGFAERKIKKIYYKENTMTNVKKGILLRGEKKKDSYLFLPSISKTTIIKGKTYRITKYFKGEQDFGAIMKTYAQNNYYKNGR